MLVKKDYCDYDTVLALRELGYPIKTIKVNNFRTDNPTAEVNIIPILLYEVQKWLRKEKGVIVGLHNNFTTREFKYYISTWEEDICTGNKYTDYEEALSDGIREAVRLILEGKLCLD